MNYRQNTIEKVTKCNHFYWNVASRQDTFLASKNDPDALLVSGQSTSTFKNLIKGIELSAFEMMEQTLNDSRYDSVIVPSQL